MSNAAFTCYAIGCEKSRRPSHLMCPDCWRRVPPALQERVLATHRVRNRGAVELRAHVAAINAARDAIAPTRTGDPV